MLVSLRRRSELYNLNASPRLCVGLVRDVIISGVRLGDCGKKKTKAPSVSMVLLGGSKREHREL